MSVPFYRTFFRVTVPVCFPAIVEIAMYLFCQFHGNGFGGNFSVFLGHGPGVGGRGQHGRCRGSGAGGGHVHAHRSFQHSGESCQRSGQRHFQKSNLGLADEIATKHRMKPKFKWIFWDNDGVMVDTEALYFRANQEILSSIGIDLTPEVFTQISMKEGRSTFVLG